MGCYDIRPLRISDPGKRVQLPVRAERLEKPFEKTLISDGEALCVKRGDSALQPLQQVFIDFILHVADEHVGLADAPHQIMLKDQIIVSYAAAYEAHVVHHIFGKSVLCTPERLFLFRLLGRSSGVISGIHYYDLIQPLHYQRRKTGIHLLFSLSAAIFYHLLRPLVRMFRKSCGNTLRRHQVAVQERYLFL